MAFWGMSPQGKDAQNMLTNIPASFWEQARVGWGRGNEEYQTGQGLRNDFLAYIREMIANGVGDPNEILALAERIMPGVSEAIGNRQDRTNRLRGQAGNIPSAGDVTGRLSGTVDEYGNSILTDLDTVGGDIRDTFGRQTQRADQFGRDRVSNIQDVFGGLNKFTTGQQGEMVGDVEGTYGGLTKDTKSTFGNLQADLDPAFAEMLKRVEAFKPGGEARAARVGRSFNPAYASVVNRLRRGGTELTSPEAIASLTRVDTARANAMDDSLAGDTERYVSAANSLSRDKLGTKQGLELRRLGETTRLGEGRLDRTTDLKSRFGDIMRQLGLAQGSEFRDELRDQEATGRNLDLARLGANTSNTNNAGGRLDNYFSQRMNIINLGRQLGMQDFDIQRMLEDRANQDDLVGFDLKNEQFDRGMKFKTTDLARRDAGAAGLEGQSNNAFRNSQFWTGAGNDAASAAYGGYGNTFQREAANAGWGKKLIGALGGAALNAVLPGSGGFFSQAMGNQEGGGGGGGVNPFTSFGNLFKKRGASSLPLKTGSPMNPYGGTTNPTFKGWNPQPDWSSYQPVMFAEGGVVDEPTMGMLGEAGETEYVVPEGKVDQFSAATLATGTPPDPSMLPGQMDTQAPAPKPTKLQLKKLDEAIKAEQSINKSWDERLRDAMRMKKLMDPESEDHTPTNTKAMKMKHASDARLEEMLDMKTAMLEMSMVA